MNLRFENRSAPEGRKNKNFHVSFQYWLFSESTFYTFYISLHFKATKNHFKARTKNASKSKRRLLFLDFVYSNLTREVPYSYSVKASTFKRKVLRPVGGGSGIVVFENKVFSFESIKPATWVSECIFITVKEIFPLKYRFSFQK